jgi:hypothetical protein
MKTSRFIFAAVIFWAMPPTGRCQEKGTVTVEFAGLEAFGHILHSFNLKPITKVENARLTPEKTLLIVFGDLDKWTGLDGGGSLAKDLENFCEKGGALLLASDYPDLQMRLPYNLTNPGISVHARGQNRYKGEWDQCPLLKGSADHPLFNNVKKGLATNNPSILRMTGSSLARLAKFPQDCYFLAALRLPADAGYLFGSPKDAPPSGRVVALAGPGVFLNGMLIQTDNDNFTFAWNTIQWLVEGPKGLREYALFIHDGKMIDNFALPLKRFDSVPIPPIQVVNRVLRGLEDENFFNRVLIENVGKEVLLRVLLFVGSLIVLILGALRIMKGRYRLDMKVPLIVGKINERAERRKPPDD